MFEAEQCAASSNKKDPASSATTYHRIISSGAKEHVPLHVRALFLVAVKELNLNCYNKVKSLFTIYQYGSFPK